MQPDIGSRRPMEARWIRLARRPGLGPRRPLSKPSETPVSASSTGRSTLTLTLVSSRPSSLGGGKIHNSSSRPITCLTTSAWRPPIAAWTAATAVASQASPPACKCVGSSSDSSSLSKLDQKNTQTPRRGALTGSPFLCSNPLIIRSADNVWSKLPKKSLSMPTVLHWPSVLRTCSLFLFLFLATNCSNASAQSSALNQSTQALYRGDYAKASNLATAHLRRFPNDAPVRVILARAEFAQAE